MSTIRIKKSELKRIIKEVHQSVLNEKIDHEGAREIVTNASRLLKALEAFRADAPPGAISPIDTLLAELSRHLENMVDNTLAYVDKPMTADSESNVEIKPKPDIDLQIHSKEKQQGSEEPQQQKAAVK